MIFVNSFAVEFLPHLALSNELLPFAKRSITPWYISR